MRPPSCTAGGSEASPEASSRAAHDAVAEAVASWGEACALPSRGSVFETLTGRLVAVLQIGAGGSLAGEARAVSEGFKAISSGPPVLGEEFADLAWLESQIETGARLLPSVVPPVWRALRLVASDPNARRQVRRALADTIRAAAAAITIEARDLEDREARADAMREASEAFALAQSIQP